MGLKAVAGGGSGGAAVTVPYKPQIVSNRCAIFNSTNTPNTSAAYTRLETRLHYYSPNAAVSQLQVGVGGFYLLGNGEVPFNFDFNCEAAVELASPSSYASFYTNNQQVWNVPNGIPFTLSSPLVGFDVPANTLFYLRMGISVGSPSQGLPVFDNIVSNGIGTGDQGVISPSNNSQIAATGNFTTPTGGFSPYGGLQPAVLLGIPSTPIASVAFIGDSIAAGTGEAGGISANGAMGYVARGLENVVVNSTNTFVPYVSLSAGGYEFANCTTALSPRLRSFWPYVTHVLIEIGNNDIALNGSTLTQMQAFLTNLTASIKRNIGPYGKRPQVAACTIFPRTTSTDSWATAANQTPIAGFTVGGTRDQYNVWLSTQVGTLIDAVIDPTPYVEDQSNKGKWVTNGTANYATADGTHPTTTFHIAAAQAVRAWAATIAP